MAARTPLPALGYPTQKAACIALFLAGERPCEIAAAVGTSVNSVHRALTEYRQANGIKAAKRGGIVGNNKPSLNQCDPIWELDEDKRRDAIRRRAAEAARAARLAA